MTAEPILPGTDPDANRQRVKQVVEQELRQVRSPEAAEAVLQRIERLAQGASEEQVARQAAATPTSGAAQVEQAAAVTPSGHAEVAQVLTTAAAQSVAATPEAEAVVAGAQDALAPQADANATPEERDGRQWLKEAVLRRMGPFQAVDARLYMAINGAPHPDWLDRAAGMMTIITTGGWIWMGVALLAKRLGVLGAREVLPVMIPTVAGATWIIEHPVKAYFRRRRPFIDVVQALVVGKKPGSWSFPSGHAAASFASAWMLSTVWKRQSPVFFAVASVVGFSRVYVGAHYPGDVTAGATLGMLLAEALRRITRAILA